MIDARAKKAFDKLDLAEIKITFAVMEVLTDLMISKKMMSLPFLYIMKLKHDSEEMLKQKKRERIHDSN